MKLVIRNLHATPPGDVVSPRRVDLQLQGRVLCRIVAVGEPAILHERDREVGVGDRRLEQHFLERAVRVVRHHPVEREDGTPDELERRDDVATLYLVWQGWLVT